MDSYKIFSTQDISTSAVVNSASTRFMLWVKCQSGLLTNRFYHSQYPDCLWLGPATSTSCVNFNSRANFYFYSSFEDCCYQVCYVISQVNWVTGYSRVTSQILIDFLLFTLFTVRFNFATANILTESRYPLLLCHYISSVLTRHIISELDKQSMGGV